MPRVTGTVTYCMLFFVTIVHNHIATPATMMTETTVAASQYFLIPDQLFDAADGVPVNFTTFPRLST